MRILIVDDEVQLLEQLKDVLTQQQYNVDTADDGEKALERIYSDPYDLIILDVMLPKKNGFEVLLELRKNSISTPILMLTARSDVDDRVRGLDLGADDYLAKPFSMAELLARIRAMLRREKEIATSILEIADIRVNTVTREAYQDNLLLNLTPKEFSILEFLLYNKNRAISRFSMAEHVWGDAFDPFIMSNNIDVHIKNLRRKIKDESGSVIRTVRGVGYIIKDNGL